MTGIWEFPEVTELTSFLLRGLQEGKQITLEEVDDQQREQAVRLLRVERLLVVGEWGDGEAEVGEDGLEVLVVYSMRGVEEESTTEIFDPAARTVIQNFIGTINSGDNSPPPEADSWFPSYSIEPVPADRTSETINTQLGDRVGSTIADLENEEVIVWKAKDELALPRFLGEKPVDEIVAELPRLSFEEMRERKKFGTPAEEPEPEPEPEPISKLEEVNNKVEKFSISEDMLEPPAGKPTKRVEKRELYDFELQMGLPSTVLEEIEGFEMGDQLPDGVGIINETEGLGTSVPPSTFPRTSTYVKYYLANEGPDYILNIYKNLIFYSAFISGFYGMKMKPGEYSSMREFMYRLYEIGERGGPEIVERLSQQEAAARGLETLPDHPTIEGEKATWLERRQYYSVVERNIEHDAWENPASYLYSED